MSMLEHPDLPARLIRRSRLAGLTAVLALLALLAVAVAPSAAAEDERDGHRGQHRPTIAEARAMPLNTVVTLDATVTTPSGAFDSSYSDEGFGIQDDTAGIFVSIPTTNIGVTPPRHVEVTGALENPAGLLMIVPASAQDVRIGGTDRPVPPKWVRTGSVGVSNQGSLVRVAGTITQGPVDDLPYGHKFFVDDGSGAVNVYVNLGTNVDVAPLAVGQRIVVTGFSSQFDGVPEIDVRGPRDLSPCRHT